MKAKTIKLIIGRKFSRLLESIEDESIRKIVEENTIVTGGCITSMLLNENVNDFDLYFRTHDAALKIANYYVTKFKANPPTSFPSGHGVEIGILDETTRIKIKVKSAGVAGEKGSNDYQYFETLPPEQGEEAGSEFVNQAINNANDLDEESEKKLDEENSKKPKYRPIFLTCNSITLSNQIQLVVRFFGEPEVIHESYDYVHCTNYWTSWDKTLVLRPEAIESILNKDLRYMGSLYPICSIIRSRKFIKRGWSITAGQYLKMAFQISKLNLEDINVLEDQLVGVDTAYFAQLIEVLQKKDPQRVDGAYLMSIIDKVF